MGFHYSPRWQDIAGLLKDDPDLFYGTMEDRERQLEEELDYAEETYTAELNASTTAPTIGDTGYEFGAFSIQGRMCDAHGEILFNGAGITAGAGTYLVKLPAKPRFYTIAAQNPYQMIGTVSLYDATANLPYQGAAVILPGVSVTNTEMFFHIDGLAGSLLTAAAPITVAAGDRLWFHVRYMIDELA